MSLQNAEFLHVKAATIYIAIFRGLIMRPYTNLLVKRTPRIKYNGQLLPLKLILKRAC
jgi:hypothetical protein